MSTPADRLAGLRAELDRSLHVLGTVEQTRDHLRGERVATMERHVARLREQIADLERKH